MSKSQFNNMKKVIKIFPLSLFKVHFGMFTHLCQLDTYLKCIIS